MYDYDYIDIATSDGGRRLRPPRYYDRLYDNFVCRDFIASLKDRRRKVAGEKTREKLRRTSLNYEQMLAVEEDIKLRRIKALKRKEV
ncbi:MAG: hypothetical protein SOY83_01195 [Anaerovoracaceae bacterium]|nr:hypothetical protein [Anaerovoracaceae bacterium]